MSIAQLDSVASILDHLAGVIEGPATDTGDPRIGTPGTHSLYAPMSRLEDGLSAFVMSGTPDQDYAIVDDLAALPDDRRSWVDGLFNRRVGPPVFAVIASSPAGATPVGEVRRVFGYERIDTVVLDPPNPPDILEEHKWRVAGGAGGGWSAGWTSGATSFRLLEGFKRCPNVIDINDAQQGVPGGFDRFFSLNAMPGRELDFYGRGLVTLDTTVEVRLRFVKAGRRNDTVAAVMQNALIIRNALCNSHNRPSSGAASDHFRALLPGAEGPQIETNDKHKVVTIDRLRLLYRASNVYSYE